MEKEALKAKMQEMFAKHQERMKQRANFSEAINKRKEAKKNDND